MSSKKQRKAKKKDKRLIPFQHKQTFSTWMLKGMPPELDTHLIYSNYGVFGIGSASAELLFIPNSYQPQATVSIPANEFLNYAGIYDMYRVVRFRIDFEVVNNDATPCVMSWLCVNEDPTGELANNMIGAPFSGSKLISAANGGQNHAHFVKELSCSTIVGSDAPETDDTYRAVINVAPSDTIWAMLKMTTVSGTSTSGVAYHVKVHQWIRFYNADLTSQTFEDDELLNPQQKLDLLAARRRKKKL